MHQTQANASRSLTSASRLLARGHEALARADWGLARRSFDAALRAGESPEAFEGLGLAAWWQDEGPTVLDARERAYTLYRRRGDRRGAARVAMLLAEDCFHFRGEAALGRGWLARARRLLHGLEPSPEHGWLKLWEGHFALILEGDPAPVRTLAAEAAAVGRTLDEVNLEMAALALEGLARVIEGDLLQGMPLLDEVAAAIVSGEMTDPVAIGLCSCFIIEGCQRTHDFDRVFDWCRRLEEFGRRKGSSFVLAVCRADLAAVLTWRGFWAEAERELEAAVRLLGRVRPGLQPEALVALAELRRRQGRFDEASTLLRGVAGHPLAIMTRAAVALDRSEAAAAARLAQLVLRQVSPRDRTHRVAALEIRLEGEIALDRKAGLAATLAELQGTAGVVGTFTMKATALRAAGLVAAAHGDHDRALRAFEDAIPLYVRSGVSFELARCRVDLARTLAALGERAAADGELRDAMGVFESLGAGHHLAAARRLHGELCARAAGAAAGDRRPAGLTRREVEVLRLLAEGMSNQRIAARLVVSPFTVKRHVTNVLTKLNVPSRAAAAAYAARAGLI